MINQKLYILLYTLLDTIGHYGSISTCIFFRNQTAGKNEHRFCLSLPDVANLLAEIGGALFPTKQLEIDAANIWGIHINVVQVQSFSLPSRMTYKCRKGPNDPVI
jgi:hypothetical protein